MLMTIGGVAVAAVLLVVALMTKQGWLKNFVLGGVAVWFAFYFAMLLSFSLTSTERDLGLNETKEFCGFYFDCHMHTTVTGIRTAKTLGNKTANGEFYIVRVKVFSDAKVARLGLDTVDAHVVDREGQEYSRDTLAEEALGEQVPFEQRILPNESFEREIVFDLPGGVESPRLNIREGNTIDRTIEGLLVDDEDSILHKRTYFILKTEPQTAATH
jgi:hypothetical protein